MRNDPAREREKENLKRNMVTNDRIQSAPEVFFRRHGRHLLLLVLAAALIAAGVAGFRYVADRLWTHTSYRIAWGKEMTGAESASYVSFCGGSVVITRDSVRFVDAKGVQRWSAACDMRSPSWAVRENYLLVYDNGGQSFIICGADGKTGGGVTSLPVTGGDIAATGVAVLRTEESTATNLGYYRSNGEALRVSIRSPLGDQGYPLDFGVSDNGQQLAVAYYSLKGGRGSSVVVFYDFEKGDEVTRQTASFDYTAGGEFIPRMVYAGNTAAYAVYDGGVIFYDVSDRTHITEKRVPVSGQIRSVFADDKHVGLVLSEDGTQSISVFDLDGGSRAGIDVVGGCSHFFFQGENVGMYADHRCRLVSFSGRVRFDLEFVNEVYAFLPGKSFGSCMLATMGELQGIRLR